MSAMQFDLKSCARSQNRMSAQHKFDLHDFKRKLSLYCIYFEIPQFNRLDTLWGGGGGGVRVTIFWPPLWGGPFFKKVHWGEGYDFWDYNYLPRVFEFRVILIWVTLPRGFFKFCHWLQYEKCNTEPIIKVHVSWIQKVFIKGITVQRNTLYLHQFLAWFICCTKFVQI